MNIESLRRTKKTGYHGSGSFRVSGALGNVDKLISDNSVSNFYKTTDTEWLLFLNNRYGEALSKKNTNKGKAHLRYTVKLKQQWGLELFSQGEYDEFQRLSSRYILGQALRYSALDTTKESLFLGFGVFYEWEKLSEELFENTPLRQDNYRFNFYLSYHYELESKQTYFLTLYVQPYKFEDFRVLSSMGYSIPINSYFSVSVEANYFYDSKPTFGVEKTDLNYLTSLNYSF